MNKVLICAVPLALIAVQAAPASAAGWGRSTVPGFNAATGRAARHWCSCRTDVAAVAPISIGLTSIVLTSTAPFNSANFHRNVTVN